VRIALAKAGDFPQLEIKSGNPRLVGEGAGSQLPYGLEPVNIRRSLRAASGFPEIMRKSFDVSMSEGLDAVPTGSVRSMRIARLLITLTGLLVSCQMFLLPVLFGNAMGVRGAVL
jgi:hypothetical protein